MEVRQHSRQQAVTRSPSRLWRAWTLKIAAAVVALKEHPALLRRLTVDGASPAAAISFCFQPRRTSCRMCFAALVREHALDLRSTGASSPSPASTPRVPATATDAPHGMTRYRPKNRYSARSTLLHLRREASSRKKHAGSARARALKRPVRRLRRPAVSSVVHDRLRGHPHRGLHLQRCARRRRAGLQRAFELARFSLGAATWTSRGSRLRPARCSLQRRRWAASRGSSAHGSPCMCRQTTLCVSTWSQPFPIVTQQPQSAQSAVSVPRPTRRCRHGGAVLACHQRRG